MNPPSPNPAPQYRDLKAGDVLREGDEWRDGGAWHKWHPLRNFTDSPKEEIITTKYVCEYRRPIASGQGMEILKGGDEVCPAQSTMLGRNAAESSNPTCAAGPAIAQKQAQDSSDGQNRVETAEAGSWRVGSVYLDKLDGGLFVPTGDAPDSQGDIPVVNFDGTTGWVHHVPSKTDEWRADSVTQYLTLHLAGCFDQPSNPDALRAADSARLDWLCANSLYDYSGEKVALIVTEYEGGNNLQEAVRSAIDAAMSQAAIQLNETRKQQ